MLTRTCSFLRTSVYAVVVVVVVVEEEDPAEDRRNKGCLMVIAREAVEWRGATRCLRGFQA